MAPVINIRNLYRNIINSKFMQKWIPEDPAKAASGLALLSTVTKDAVNCGYYTYQSYNNKRIPEDKRKFVAANDLSNGFYNVVIPLLLKGPIDKSNKYIFDTYFKKYFSDAAAKNIYSKIKDTNSQYTLEMIKDNLSKKSLGFAKSGLGVIFTLVVSQIICKRIITPTLATPSADYIKKVMEKMEESKAKKAEAKDMIENNSVDEYNFKPSVYIIDSKTFEPFDNLVKKSLKYKE